MGICHLEVDESICAYAYTYTHFIFNNSICVRNLSMCKESQPALECDPGTLADPEGPNSASVSEEDDVGRGEKSHISWQLLPRTISLYRVQLLYKFCIRTLIIPCIGVTRSKDKIWPGSQLDQYSAGLCFFVVVDFCFVFVFQNAVRKDCWEQAKGIYSKYCCTG